MNENIKNIAKIINSKCRFQNCNDCIKSEDTCWEFETAIALDRAGYRKQSETVKEKELGSCKACGDNIIRDFDKEIPTLREKNSYLITDEGKVKLCFIEKLGKNEEGSILYISDINYCPNCGRKLADNGKEDK